MGVGNTSQMGKYIAVAVMGSSMAYGLVTAQASVTSMENSLAKSWEDVDSTVVDPTKVGWQEGQVLPKAPPLPDSLWDGFMGRKGTSV